MAEIKNCEQCNVEFEAKSKITRFHSRTCQVDAYRGVSKEESIRRRETGFAWDPAKQAKPVTIKLPKQEKAPELLKGWKTAAVLPDIQFGYHYTSDGLDPFHCERSLKVVREIVVQERPDVSVFLGDVLDLPMLGKFRQYPSFMHTIQPTIDRAHEEIAIVSEASGETRYMSGNHDERLHNYIIDNMFAAAGVRRAKKQTDPSDGYPALSIQNLLRLDELGVKYVGAYPAGATYLNDELACIHGRLLGNKNQSAAQQVVEEERVSVIFGHTHRISEAWKTQNTRGAGRYTRAFSPGCLCRVDGTVPSTRGGVDVFGRPVKSWENWQNGMAIVRYNDDGRFHIESIPIIEGWAMRDNGEEYVAL